MSGTETARFHEGWSAPTESHTRNNEHQDQSEMGSFPDREHYIPIRASDIVEYVCGEVGPHGEPLLSSDEQAAFRRFARSVSGHVHSIYLGEIRRLKEAYSAFDPDPDPRPLVPLTEEQRATLMKLTERYCVVYQTLRNPPPVAVGSTVSGR